MEKIKCPNCDGNGATQVRTSSRRFVTRDMAMDAGDLSLTGSLYSDEDFDVEPCDFCEGTGEVLAAEQHATGASGANVNLTRDE